MSSNSSTQAVEKLGVLGRGTYGIVHRARWNGHIVAVKEMIYSDDQKAAFENELSLFEKVKHKNIIKLLAHSVGIDNCSLIMEYADCGNLYDLLHRDDRVDYTMEHALTWSHQTAQALAYLHNMSPTPLVHRDVKPPNLLLMNFCRTIKICDFGTACDVHTHMTTNKGSSYWMAPEVFNNNISNSSSRKYTEKCDTFSFGIVVWEIFARRKPHIDFVNSFAVMWAVNAGTRPPPLQNCPQPLEDLITRCWAHEPADRPSMSSVVKRLGQMTDLIIKSELPEIHLPQANKVTQDNSVSESTSLPFDTVTEPPHNNLYAFLQSPTQNYQPFNLINTDPGGSQENLLDVVRRRLPSDRTCHNNNNNCVPKEQSNHLAPQVPERRPRSSSVSNRNAPENRVNDVSGSRLLRSPDANSALYDEVASSPSGISDAPHHSVAAAAASSRTNDEGYRSMALAGQIDPRYRPLQPDTGNTESMRIFNRHQEMCYKYMKLLTEHKLLIEREKELSDLESNGQPNFYLPKELHDTKMDEVQLRTFCDNLKQQLNRIKLEKLSIEAERDGFQYI